MEADALVGRYPWERWLDVSGRPALGGFARPAADTDVLRAGDESGRILAHPDPTASGHRPGVPRVHQGRIGSANRSLRDARVRDALSREHGLRAFEMEGVGVGQSSFLNGLEWLIIRGVSDYADSRTTSGWRLYASLAAAAYLRALLGECHPFR